MVNIVNKQNCLCYCLGFEKEFADLLINLTLMDIRVAFC